jgi:F0F1-type ATP synthase membrane subunit b/b'
MSDQFPYYTDEESRSLESVPMEPQPVHSAETEVSGGEALSDQPLSGPAGDGDELPPPPEAPARSSTGMVIGLGVAAAVLAAFSGYQLLQAKESGRLLDEAYAKVATVETSRTNLEADFQKTLSQKDMEIEEARAHSQRLTESLAKEEEKNRILQAHAAKAAEVDSLNSTYRELAKGMAKVEDEVRRLSGETASRKKSSSVSKSTQKPASAVERSVVQIANGPNKGRWHFVAADGFRSPLYGSREGALRDAKLHARNGY